MSQISYGRDSATDFFKNFITKDSFFQVDGEERLIIDGDDSVKQYMVGYYKNAIIKAKKWKFELINIVYKNNGVE